MVGVGFGDTSYTYGGELLTEESLLDRQYVSKSGGGSGGGSLRGSGRRERGGKTSRPPKMRQKKYNEEGQLEDADDLDLGNSLMKRRRKAELQIQVRGVGRGW